MSDIKETPRSPNGRSGGSLYMLRYAVIKIIAKLFFQVNNKLPTDLLTLAARVGVGLMVPFGYHQTDLSAHLEVSGNTRL